ncbi:hypothetical protein [Emticicia agri]|uniref:hypothetical protein n=1 Tax=Emticicia agri TaxID=2492393 RepID=UPI0013EBB495|nr:hypothetical protein [Emticicia agri]
MLPISIGLTSPVGFSEYHKTNPLQPFAWKDTVVPALNVLLNGVIVGSEQGV